MIIYAILWLFTKINTSFTLKITKGGSGANEAKIFDRTKNNAVVGTVTGLSRVCCLLIMTLNKSL